MIEAGRSVRTTCPYCGVGCQIDLQIKDERIYGGETRPSPREPLDSLRGHR